jgi:hypothetical protein
MADLSFEFVDVGQKPRRKFRKASKYDPILDKFFEGTSSLSKVEVPGKNPNYVRLQLKKRIDARELGKQVGVSVVNNLVYLEKI